VQFARVARVDFKVLRRCVGAVWGLLVRGWLRGGWDAGDLH
jgi:hypothetical protein